VRAIFCTVSVFIGMLLVVADAQNGSIAHRQSSASESAGKIVTSGWTQDETMLSKAILLRAQKLEKKTSFRFDKNWIPQVSLEWSVGTRLNGSNGSYKAETQTMYFPIRILYELTARHRQASDSLTAETAAEDTEFGELVDHELGHDLMDQVSRRNGLGPWFSEERFNKSTDEEKLGLDILSEGTAEFFQNANFPRDYSDLSAAVFPATTEEQQFYSYKMIAYDGGYWIVRDILNRFGERGLIWLMLHPFVASNDMRAAAVAYRERALKDLAEE